MIPAFFVVMLFGEPVLSIGPVDKATCASHLADESSKLDSFYRDPAKVAALKPYRGRIITRADLALGCLEKRPLIRDAVKVMP